MSSFILTWRVLRKITHCACWPSCCCCLAFRQFIDQGQEKGCCRIFPSHFLPGGSTTNVFYTRVYLLICSSCCSSFLGRSLFNQKIINWQYFIWLKMISDIMIRHAIIRHERSILLYPDRKVDIKDNHLGIKLIPMISTWDQVDPTFPVRMHERIFALKTNKLRPLNHKNL
jgi:hypothetical protein